MTTEAVGRMAPVKITTPALAEFLTCAGGLIGYGVISAPAFTNLWPWPQWYRNVGFWLFLCVVQYFGYRMVVWWHDLARRWRHTHPKTP